MKYAILGTGQVALRHALAFSKIKNLSLVGFLEKDIKKSKFFSKKFNTKKFKNLDDLLKQNIDFIIISLPHNQRINPIIKCINYKVNLLIEKPLCLNKNELNILLPYIKNRNVKIAISFVHRFRKEVIQTKKLLINNLIGKIRIISENMHSYKNPLLPKWIDNKKISGGGVLMYNAIHSIDKLIYLTQSKIVSVTAKKNNINKKLNVEDNIIVILKFKNGVIASLFSTFTPYKINPTWQTLIFGEKGLINLNIRKGLFVTSQNQTKEYNYSEYYNRKGLNYNFYLQAISFVNSLKKKKKPFINEKDGINSILVVDAIYQSIKLNKTINLN
tara:strand:+ start:157 stop:1146 length:990 start_codon:yes stop_codon:yes gene_type:complete